MNIVLVNPASPFLIRQDVMAPLGLFFLSAVLKQAGHSVQIVDLGLGDEVPKGADVYGLTGTSAQRTEMEHASWKFKNEKGLKIAGGPHATLDPDFFFKLGFDTVVIGEGEEVINRVIIGRTTGIVRTERIRNIDNLFPDRSQQGRYHYEIDGVPAVTMMTSRGCPYNCAFCSKDVWGHKHVLRDGGSVVKEIDQVYPVYKAIMFYDDTFAIDKARLRFLCGELCRRGIIWRCLVRSDEVDYDLLRLMALSGCKEIGIGVESGSPRILANVNKRETVNDHRKCIAAAHTAGLRVKAFVIVGLPGETWETIRETNEFLEETQPDDLDVTILSVYPGSDIAKHPEKYDLAFGGPTYYKGKPGQYQATVATSGMTGREIVMAREMLHQKYKK